jgi:hypothetical protein
MARFYAPISKDDFLKKVEALFDPEFYPYDLPAKIKTDLAKVEFDWENYSDFDEEEGFSTYFVGYKELIDGFHVFFTDAGGDWEHPICFIYYWDGKQLRGYIPEYGNAYNKTLKSAYGNNEDHTNNHTSEEDNDKIIADIINRITLRK